jgi:hypothetical protein
MRYQHVMGGKKPPLFAMTGWQQHSSLNYFPKESVYHSVLAENGAFLPTNNKLPPQHFKKIAQI